MGRLILYTRTPEETAAFYCLHFGYDQNRRDGDRIVDLRPRGAGLPILLHPAAQGQKAGQAPVKLVFHVPDVDGFCQAAAARGLMFGPIHRTNSYCFANAKDPEVNSISSRAFAP